MSLEKEALEIIKELVKIRTYNSAGVFKGIRIKDNEKCYDIINKARALVEKIKNE